MTVSLALTVLTIIVSFAAAWKRKPAPPKWQFVALLPIVLGFAFWFLTAPNVRFANGLILLFEMISVLLLLSHVMMLAARHFAVFACIVLLLIDAPLLRSLERNPGLFTKVSSNGFQPLNKQKFKQVQTASGLGVYIPQLSDNCWDSTLPCSPYDRPSLRLRGNDLRSGFSLENSCDRIESECDDINQKNGTRK
jgi:hypothetical protein